MWKFGYVAVSIMFFVTGCIGDLQVRSPIPRTTIRTGADSYIEVVPMEAHIEWATVWPFPYPYGNSGRGRR